MDLVSVVIPCYNSGATLPQTLASVEAQTWQQIEIVVVDDGSTDPQTRSVLDQLENTTLIRQPNGGLPAARNAGFRAARGKYVLPLDADDWLEPDAVATLLSALQSSPDASYAFCDTQLEGEASGILRKQYNYFEQLSLNQLPYCLLMPKRVWEEAGGYDESMKQGYEDWEFNIRLGKLGYHALRVARPLFHYRVRSEGMLISKSNRIHGLLWSEIQAKHPSLYTPVSFAKIWRQWSHAPSRYPLPMYFIWLGLHRILPVPAFATLFRRQRSRVHRGRASLC